MVADLCGQAGAGPTSKELIDSLLGIQEGRNPRVIEEILKTYLPSSKRNISNDEVQAPQDD